MHVVVGSGPAGVACARALLDQGLQVRMLDAGLTLEPERLGLIQRLKQRRPEEWDSAELTAYRAGMDADASGVPIKLVYGSDFAYRDAEADLGLQYTHVGLRPSLAQGGLSNVWGAAVMPFAQRDTSDWPFGPEALAEHYKAALRLTGAAAAHDGLEKLFPLYIEHPTTLRPSRQASQLINTMERNRAGLAKNGIHFGSSRLAVRGNGVAGEDGCVYCRLCMYGCPFGYIYNSSDTLKQLQNEATFTYEPGVITQGVRESPHGVRITGFHRMTRQPLVWDCERVFLAAGAIPTTRILLHSLEAYDQTVWLKDSQYFLMPLMLLRRPPPVQGEWLHALSQIFLEIFDKGRGDRTTHVQIYSNNDLINQAVEKAFGPLKWPLEPLVRNLQDRLLVAQGFLHSDLSSRISVRLSSEKVKGGQRMYLQADLNPAAKREVRKVVFKLLNQSRRLGAMPLLPMLKLGEPGRSFHSGASFPMARQPSGFQTDLLGRPCGWQRVHAVDATVFPSIPATTITLSVMANAHRIASEAAKEEDLR